MGALLAAFIGTALFSLLIYASGERGGVVALFRAIAKQRGGRVIDGILDLRVDGVEVDVMVQQDPPLTFWHAYPPSPGVPAFMVQLAGSAPIPDNADVRRMWTADLALMLDDRFPRGSVTVQPSRIRLAAPGHATTIEQIDAGIATVVALAKADPYGMRLLKGLPDASEPRDGFVKIAGPQRIEIGLVRGGDDIVRTVLVTDPVEISAEHVQKLGEVDVIAEPEQLELRWRGVERNREHLIGAIELIRRLSQGPSLGAFR